MNLDIFTNLPPQLAVIITAMLPVTELRASIPFAIGYFKLSYFESLFYSIIGAYLPSIAIIYGVGPISKFLINHSKLAAKFFDWLFERTRKKFKHKYATWGNLALMVFVAIPLPATGVWTGSLAAWLFGIKKKQALLYIALGAMISGIIVLILSVGAYKII